MAANFVSPRRGRLGSTRDHRRAPGFSVLLSGRSPVTGEDERATLFTRSLPDGHVIYALSIAPARLSEALDRSFVRMMRTLVVNDDAIHRGNRGRPVVGGPQQ
jgi:hypothetical protein